MMNEKQQIEEMAKVLKDYTKKNNIMASHVILDAYAEELYSKNYRKMPDNIGDFSDGYHTFNELYHHRAVLFSVICNMMPEKAWKSKLHNTGDMFNGMFIVGIETEQGQATYHYDIEPYWDMFKVKELEKAPKWDGHTPADAIKRIENISSKNYRKQEWISVAERLPEKNGRYLVFIKVSFFEDITIQRILEYNKSQGFNVYSVAETVTHWMHLPEAPKMKGENDGRT